MNEYYIGLMSGTSLDAVDAVLMDFSAMSGQRCVHHVSLLYSPQTREQILALQDIGADELNRSNLLANQLSLFYIQAVKELLAQSGLETKQICAIGCHGQTIRHAPHLHFTIQLANLALIAEQTGIDVVGDFRSRDIAAGGQGAPLVPAFHQYLFGHPEEDRVVLNIGGIANISVLPQDGKVTGFDTGPGNMLMDAWTRKNWQKDYDDGGHFAARGQVIEPLLKQLLADEYFSRPHPKSTGRDHFNLHWLAEFLRGDKNPFDIQATLLALTATSITEAIAHSAGTTHRVIVCGGGVHNKVLFDLMQTQLPQVRFDVVDAYGIDSQCVEGAAFAWLARQFTHRIPANVPEVTGALGPRILGALYPA